MILRLSKNIYAFLIIGILGTLGHFVYEWTGNNVLAGLIFPVNESIWEHLKLIFFPASVYFLAEYLLSDRKDENYIPSAIKSIFCGMLSVVVLYYTISGIIGKNIDFINILIFFAAVFITVYKRNKYISEGEEFSEKQRTFLIISFIATAVLFMIWSYFPPKIGIFISAQ